MKNILILLSFLIPSFLQGQEIKIEKRGKDSLAISVTRYTMQSAGQTEGYFSVIAYAIADSALYAPILYEARERYAAEAAQAEKEKKRKADAAASIDEFGKKNKIRIGPNRTINPTPPPPDPEPPGPPGRRNLKKKN